MPVVFDEHHLSEVQNMASEEKLDQVVDSMKESKVALIGEDSARGLSALPAGNSALSPVPLGAFSGRDFWA